MRLKELSPDSIVQRDGDIIAAEAGEDIVMVSISKGLYYGVSDVAREIWQSIENPIRVSELITNLCEAHDVDRASCEEQTLSFLRDLMAEGLLRVTDGENT